MLKSKIKVKIKKKQIQVRSGNEILNYFKKCKCNCERCVHIHKISMDEISIVLS